MHMKRCCFGKLAEELAQQTASWGLKVCHDPDTNFPLWHAVHQLSGGKVWVITGKGEQSGGVQFDEVGKMLEGLCTDKLVDYYQEKNKKGAYLVVLAKPIAA